VSFVIAATSGNVVVAALVAAVAATVGIALTAALARASEAMKQAQTDAGELVGLIVKHGHHWGGNDGRDTPVTAYQAAARLQANSAAQDATRDAARKLLDIDPRSKTRGDMQAELAGLLPSLTRPPKSWAWWHRDEPSPQ
jgi:hypothetical protein